jgi:hypothetical protein
MFIDSFNIRRAKDFSIMEKWMLKLYWWKGNYSFLSPTLTRRKSQVTTTIAINLVIFYTNVENVRWIFTRWMKGDMKDLVIRQLMLSPMMYQTRHPNLRIPKAMCDVVITNLYKDHHWYLNSSAFNHVTRNNQTFKII